jgi:hypothetical protein
MSITHGTLEMHTEFLIEVSEVKRILTEACRSWEYNIQIDLKEIRCEGVDEIQVVQGRGQ